MEIRRCTTANPIGPPQASAGRALPNFDIRLVGRGEFNDIDLSSTSGQQAAMQNARTRSRASAVGQFRSSFRAENAANLRAVVNEAGAMKNFFLDGGTISEPQSIVHLCEGALSDGCKSSSWMVRVISFADVSVAAM